MPRNGFARVLVLALQFSLVAWSPKYDPSGALDADLRVTLSDSPDPVTVGGSLAYIVTVTNLGPHADAAVTLTDTLPANVDLLWATPGCVHASTVTCNLGSLGKDESRQVTLVVTPRAAGTITNTATAIGSGSDPDQANNTATQSTRVIPPPTVRFSAPAYSVNENAGPAVITATLSVASESIVSVKYTTSDGTAVAGAAGDYITATGSLTFNPGMTSQTFSVPIVNDTIHEANEALSVRLSDPAGALLGTPGVATLAIQDDDAAPTVQFSKKSYAVTEGAGSAIVIATLSAAMDVTATVRYTTADGTAVSGSDYAASTGTLTFSPGQTADHFVVPIVPDTTDEPDETVALRLSDYHNAAPGSPDSVVLTIIDDDGIPTVRLANSTYATSESTQAAAVTATLSNDSAFTVRVNVASHDGTATSGEDYPPVASVLVFPAGETTISFSVPITDDAVVEQNETLMLELTAPINATVGSPMSATLTILNDDRYSGNVYLPLVMKQQCVFTSLFECEPNDVYSIANGPLASGIDYFGRHTGESADRDYFSLYLAREGRITIDLSDITADEFGRGVQLQVFYLNTSIRIGYDVEGPDYHIVCPSAGKPECGGGLPGWYYILVYTPRGYSHTALYRLRVTYP